MSEADFDLIFSGVVDENAEAQDFLSALQEIIPDAFFKLCSCSEGGEVVAEYPAWELAIEAKDGLLGKIRDDNSLASIKLADHEWLYGTFIHSLDAVLLFTLPGTNVDFTQETGSRRMLRSCIDHALLKQGYRELATEKEQFIRQIDMLKQQHGKLIEDNYRQYLLSQEKEKEYARKLESEIAFQTAELREKNSQLETFSRLQGEFLANMSHELRTPMNAIIGFAELMAETDLDNEQADYIKTISQSAASLLVLINDILDLAKIESGKLDLENEPFDLPGVVENVIAMFKIPAESKNIVLRHEVDPRIPATIIGDGHRLKQVLVNLTANAMKFTEKGSVTVLVEYDRQADEGLAARFSVQDTGIGIPPERQRAIFDKFTQADGSTTRKYGGTGLGLAICDQLVDMMGGVISVESVVGEGTVFFFTLPLRSRESATTEAEAEEVAATAVVEPPKAEKVQRGGNILLVEDNLVNQRLASIIVTRQGHTVEVAADGLEALEQLKNKKFDVVLMDIQMPNMDGMAAARKIRELEGEPSSCDQYIGLRGRERPVPIIGLTAHARKEDENACYAAGMDGFLTKPIIKDKLLEVLQIHLSGNDGK